MLSGTAPSFVYCIFNSMSGPGRVFEYLKSQASRWPKDSLIEYLISMFSPPPPPYGHQAPPAYHATVGGEKPRAK